MLISEQCSNQEATSYPLMKVKTYWFPFSHNIKKLVLLVN